MDERTSRLGGCSVELPLECFSGSLEQLSWRPGLLESILDQAPVVEFDQVLEAYLPVDHQQAGVVSCSLGRLQTVKHLLKARELEVYDEELGSTLSLVAAEELQDLVGAEGYGGDEALLFPQDSIENLRVFLFRGDD